MQPPVCRTCGKPHWSRLCDGENATPRVARNETRPVATEIVAVSVADLEIENRQLRTEVERLTSEVASLKRELAARTSKPPPMTATERSRKLRERQRGLKSAGVT